MMIIDGDLIFSRHFGGSQQRSWSSRNPVPSGSVHRRWIPAFAGMTNIVDSCS